MGIIGTIKQITLEEGIEKGLSEERKRKKLELAKRNREIAENLLKRGMSIEEVSEITTLTISEVASIAKKLKK